MTESFGDMAPLYDLDSYPRMRFDFCDPCFVVFNLWGMVPIDAITNNIVFLTHIFHFTQKMIKGIHNFIQRFIHFCSKIV